MIFLGLLAALALIVCGGYGVTTLVMRAPGRFSVLEHFGVAWLLGTALVSLLLWFCGLWISGWPLQAAITVICLGLGINGWLASARSGVKLSFPFPASAIEWLLAGVVAAELAIMFWLSFNYPLGWDGLLNWEIKARYAFLNGGVIPAAYYADASRSFSHPDYPPCLPLVEAWLYLWMGEAHQFWSKVISPMFYAAGVIILAAIGARLTGRRWLALLVAALFFFVPFLTSGYGGVLYGYADFPLSVFYLAAVGYLLSSLGNDTRTLRLYFVFLACLPWIKREGVILWAIAALCGAVVIWRRKESWRWLFCLFPGLLVIALWQIFLSSRHAIRSQEFGPMSVSVWWTNLDRGVWIFRGLSNEIMAVNRWSLFWLLALVAFGYLFTRARDLRLTVLSIAVFVPIAAFCGTYFFSVWENYLEHIATSLPRLLLQVVPVGWLAIVLALRPAAVDRNDEKRTLVPDVPRAAL